MYDFNAHSCSVLTNVALLILSFVSPCASHTTLTMNQNWSRSSFCTPLNIGSLIALAILNCGDGGGGVGGDRGEGVLSGNLVSIQSY